VSGANGVPSVLTVKAAAAALNIDERVLLRWVRAGHVDALQHTPGGRYWVPAAEVERYARLILTTPDWRAVLDAE
jgi:excisionase family DNA binding protein